MCACKGTGRIHDEVMPGAWMVIPCPCQPKVERDWKTFFERFEKNERQKVNRKD